MKVLMYGINYAPELTGIGKYTGELATWLAARGHEVTVITSMPYYPKWEVHDQYKGRGWHVEKTDGVTIYRSPLYVPSKLSAKTRILQEVSFIASTFPAGLKKLLSKKVDIVINVCPPFHLSLFPLLYGLLRRVPVVTHVQDLQVDVARDLNMIKNKNILSLMLKLERWMFRRSSMVTTISKGMYKKIVAKSIPPQKCMVLPNWVDEHAVTPLNKEQSLYREFGLQLTDKVILYSGNLGEKQGLEVIIEVANSFRSYKDVYFIIVGSGGAEAKLKELAGVVNLPNVKFFPLQPYEKLPALLATADLHLVLQKKSASDLVMPSKITGILAAGGVPIVTAGAGTTLYQLIEEHNMGILVEPENAKALAAGIMDALESDLSLLKNNARQYAEQHLSKEVILQNWESMLYNIHNNVLTGTIGGAPGSPKKNKVKIVRPEKAAS
ncbi:MAG: WcaI family glycosyltransferase [Chitinophagaceae bacterium]|nr:WcaI family glycosyltransferase [Chitinophagaceae bacterium]